MDYVGLIRQVTDHMCLPDWYHEDAAISTGYLAIRKGKAKWQEKRKEVSCTYRTFLKNQIRWAIQDEVRLLWRTLSVEISLEDMLYGLREE